MLYVVAPLYGVLQLAYMIFAIFFSPSGFTKNRRVSLTDMEGAYLADDIIITFFLFAVMAALLFIGAKRTTWNGYGGSVQTSKYYFHISSYESSLTDTHLIHQTSCQHNHIIRILCSHIMDINHLCSRMASQGASLLSITTGLNHMEIIFNSLLLNTLRFPKNLFNR